MKRPNTILKGTTFSCRGCSNLIGVFNRDVGLGEKSSITQLDFTAGNEYKRRDEMVCKACGMNRFVLVMPDGQKWNFTPAAPFWLLRDISLKGD